MRFGTWNVRSLYRAGLLTAADRELTRYKLDLVGTQEFRWDKGGTVRAGDYKFFLWKRKRKSSIGNRIFLSSSLYICHGVGPLVDPFRSHVSRSLFKGLP
jgi:hypothetical protein